jgi:pimeloyl-ACP methyl ester carboxylesterase
MTLGYQKYGAGPHKVMALHGWFGDHTTYDPMRNALSPEEFTYVFPAYRGYGLSRHLTGAYTNKEIAGDVIALADELRWDTFSLVGHSMGGKAIQRVLADAPKRVRKLVAVTPVPASPVPLDDATWKLFDSAARNMNAREGIMAFAVGNRLSKAWTDYMARYSAQTSTVEAFAAYLLAWAKEDFVADVQGREVPIKVIVGQYDMSLTEDVMRATYLAWYRNAELEVMPNAGHYPADETPIALATSIEAFLRK